MSPPSKPHPEAFWPTIKQAIDKGSNTNSDNQSITPQCPICMEPLPVKSFPVEGELDAEVLLCGHVLCQPCRQQWERSNLGDRCPACRTSLYCSRCGVDSIALAIPKNGEESSLPPGLPEGNQDLCPDCQAEVEFHRDVENGEWPHNLDDMEPGFVNLFYHVVNDIEKGSDIATLRKVQDAINDTIMQEFDNMMVSRRMVTLGRGNTLRKANPWYAENTKRQENRRHGIIGFDSDDDEEPHANTPAGVPYPIRNPFLLGEGDRQVHQPAPLQPQPGDVVRGRLANNPVDHRGYVNPFDVQDGIAPPNAAAQAARSAQDHDRQPPDDEELRRWSAFLERDSSPATAEAARPAAPRNFQAASDYEDANEIASLTDRIGQVVQQIGSNREESSATRQASTRATRWATRRATGEPGSAPGAPEPPTRQVGRASTAAGSMARQSRTAAPQTAVPARNYPEGSASAILAQYSPMFHRLERSFTRPADMPSWDEIVDDANAYEAAHYNDPNYPPRTRAEYIAEHEEHMRRIVANSPVASSSSPASGASQDLFSMDLDDSDEDMLSVDQPVSQR
ncbi:hypothetical protein FBULB1_3710 [Fusarium bulbicola]|nr:hypothetical protein FBULB1_3710 [Fusarium bulbicola]